MDGKPLPLDYFARVEAGQLHGPDLATASPDFILETTAAGAGRYVPRQFLVFFDDERLLPFDRKPVIEGLRDFVTRLSPSDSMAILSYNSSSHVITPFTNSKENLLDGLSRLEKVAPRGLFWESQYRQDVNLARRSRLSSRDSIIRSYGDQIRSREKGTLDELKRAFAALAARSGKRVAFWVSSGIELRPGQTFANALSSSLLNQFDESVVEESPRRRRRGEPVRHHGARARRAGPRDRRGRLGVRDLTRGRLRGGREPPRGARGPR